MKMFFAAFLAVALIFSPPALTAERRYEIPLADSPALGPADAHVTIVEFINFQ